MVYLSELVVAGLMLGGLYGVVALGLVLIYKATKVFNFAQGEMVMVGAYSFYNPIDYQKLQWTQIPYLMD